MTGERWRASGGRGARFGSPHAAVFVLLMAGPVSCAARPSSSTSAKPAAAVVQADPKVPRTPAEVSAFVQRYVDNGDFSGVIGVARDSEPPFASAYGFASLEPRREVSVDDTFHIASITKTFTALAIRRLRDEGSLSLDDPLSRYLPDFPRGRDITIRHLLLHQSGVADYWSRPDVEQRMQHGLSLSELVTWLGESPLEFEPGARSAYSNSGYALLAAVVQRVGGREFHQSLAGRVVEPAGLVRTDRFDGSASAVGMQPWWGADLRRPSPPYDPSILIGAGSLQSTAVDLLQWGRYNLGAGVFVEQEGEYPYGWGVREADGHAWVEQSGRNPGYAAYLAVAPAEQLVVVVLSNTESEAAGEIGRRLLFHELGARLEVPPRRATVALDEPQAYVGRYEVAPSFVVDVVHDGGHLLLRGRSGPALPLDPIGANAFFYRQLYVRIDAERGADGRITALLWGGDHRCPRIAG